MFAPLEANNESPSVTWSDCENRNASHFWTRREVERTLLQLLSPMEIHQLRYFIAVAEEGSFSRAAAREHDAQPSLSQQIQKLEADLDQRLFDRLPRSIVTTDAGRCLLPRARQILLEIANARRCVDDLKEGVAGSLAVGALPTI